MEKKTYMRAGRLAAAAALLLGTICAAPAQEPRKPASGGADAVFSEPSPLEPRAALAAQSRLALGLVGRVARGDRPPDNVVVSPASLAAVLALLDLGAEERMRRAIHRTLGFERGEARTAATDL